MRKDNYPLHIFLFLLTLLTTTMAGAELVRAGKWFASGMESSLSWSDLVYGLPFSLSFLSFLTVHEFGHYLTARRLGVPSSLPYYIPVFLPFMLVNIGSFGAVIRLRGVPDSRRKYFAIGVAGPLAGFVISLVLLTIGVLTLPDLHEYVYDIHPIYENQWGKIPTAEFLNARSDYPILLVGTNILTEGFALLGGADWPPPHELMHYPFLFSGFLTLFFTSLNLLPVGQLDGGHVVYGMFGPAVAGLVSRVTVMVMIFLGGTGVFTWEAFSPRLHGSETEYWIYGVASTLVYVLFIWRVMYRMFPRSPGRRVLSLTLAVLVTQVVLCLAFPGLRSNPIWLVFTFLTTFMVGLDHPVTLDESPLTRRQRILGWIAVAVFILCFSYIPLDILI